MKETSRDKLSHSVTAPIVPKAQSIRLSSVERSPLAWLGAK